MTSKSEDIETVKSLRIACTGGKENITEGHPKVWLRISERIGQVRCPYCEKIFVFDET